MRFAVTSSFLNRWKAGFDMPNLSSHLCRQSLSLKDSPPRTSSKSSAEYLAGLPVFLRSEGSSVESGSKHHPFHLIAISFLGGKQRRMKSSWKASSVLSGDIMTSESGSRPNT